MYEEKKEFNVLQGKIPDFRKINVIASVNGEEVSNIPNKEDGYTVVNVYCDKNAIGVWNNEEWKLEIEKMNDREITCTVYFIMYFSEYLISKSREETTLEIFSHAATNQTPALIDYRYTGSNPDNYVCFGSEEETCPGDNLYRIIGVIPTQTEVGGIYENRVKLIKSNYYIGETAITGTYTYGGKGYLWHSTNINKWESATLNLQILNNEYWNGLGTYQKYIGKSLWYLGAANYNNTKAFTSNGLYSAERSNTRGYNKGALNYANNIGLLYPSDFGYSLGSSNAGQVIYTNRTKYISGAWLYNLQNRYYEWTITPESSFNSGSAIYIMNEGWTSYAITSRIPLSVRPAFYLKSNVLYKNGNGSMENPYRISIMEE